MIARLRYSRAVFRERLNDYNTLRYIPRDVKIQNSHKDALRSEVGPDNGVVGGTLSLTRLQVYAYLTAGGGEGSGS